MTCLRIWKKWEANRPISHWTYTINLVGPQSCLCGVFFFNEIAWLVVCVCVYVWLFVCLPVNSNDTETTNSIGSSTIQRQTTCNGSVTAYSVVQCVISRDTRRASDGSTHGLASLLACPWLRVRVWCGTVLAHTTQVTLVPWPVVGGLGGECKQWISLPDTDTC